MEVLDFVLTSDLDRLTEYEFDCFSKYMESKLGMPLEVIRYDPRKYCYLSVTTFGAFLVYENSAWSNKVVSYEELRTYVAMGMLL